MSLEVDIRIGTILHQLQEGKRFLESLLVDGVGGHGFGFGLGDARCRCGVQDRVIGRLEGTHA